MKSNAIARIIIFSLAILILIGILLGVTCFNMFIVDGKIQFETEDMITEPVGMMQMLSLSSEIRNIEIEWAAGDITIQTDENATDIQITECAPIETEHQMVYKQSGQTLKIQFSKDSIEFPSFGLDVDISKDLVITVPADWSCNSLEIDTAAAKVMMNGLTIQEFDLDGASGICDITDCNITEMDIDTASGDVNFTGTLETLDFDAASAGCSIEVTNIPRSIELDGMSGDLELILPPDAGYICNLDTMSGSFDSDFTFKTHDGTYVCGNGECKINVSGMSSDVSILKGIA